MTYFFNGSLKWAMVLDMNKPIFKQIKNIKEKMSPKELCVDAAA